MLKIYKASAGSGKTFTLAREYIALLLGYKDEKGKWHLIKKHDGKASSILAVTFTNKATAEMKKRIVEQLAILADPVKCHDRKISKYIDYLTALYHVPAEQIREAAADALKCLLVGFDDFNVSTIDSFFQLILRTFAHEMELPDNFELRLDDMEVVKEAVRDVFDTINGNSFLLSKKDRIDTGRLQMWLQRYMEKKMDDGDNFMLFREAGQFFNEVVKHINGLMDEDYRLNNKLINEYLEHPTKLIEFERGLAESQANEHNELKKEAAQFLKRIEFLNLSGDVKSNAVKALVKFANGTLKFKNFPADIKKIAEDPSNAINKKSTKRLLEPEVRQFVDDLHDYCLNIEERINRIGFLRLLLSNIYPLGIFGEVIRRMEIYRREKSSILLSDTNQLLHHLIGDDDTPFIYERLGNRLRHFLLDEFQDTSKMQWLNLRPLLINSLSFDYENLIIGDEKQCIYRFRNSDPRLINSGVKKSLPYEIEIEGKTSEQNTNWRSETNIVVFNNSLFKALSKVLDATAFYENVVQSIPEKRLKEEPKGWVDLMFVDTKNSEKSKEELEEIPLSRMFENVVRQLRAGYRPWDITVLTRTGAESKLVVRYLIEAFEKLENPPFSVPKVMSADAFTLEESGLVLYIISHLQAIANPSFTAGVDLKRKTRKPELLNEEYLINLMTADNPVTALKESLKTLGEFPEDLTDKGIENNHGPVVEDKLQNTDLVALSHLIVKEFITPLDKKKAENLLRRENIFLSNFMDLLDRYVEENGNDIYSFLKFWNDKGRFTKVEFPENHDTIRVITIHKSKGLEFPCVHIPFAKFKLHDNAGLHKDYKWYKLSSEIIPGLTPPFFPLPTSKDFEKYEPLREQYLMGYKEEELDNLNLLYVAFTRASQELIVTAKLSEKSETSSNKIQDVADLMMVAIKNSEEPDSGLVVDLKKLMCDEFHLTFGEPTVNEGSHKEEKTETKNEIATISVDSFTKRKSILQITVPEVPVELNFSDPAVRGDFLHLVMSRIRYPEDLDFALKKSAYEYQLSDEETNCCRKILEKGLSFPDAQRWFNGFTRILNETTIFDDRSLTNSYSRPDRIVWNPDGTVDIVDYKFGHLESEEYKEQMMGYVNRMIDMGFQNVKGYIWYVERNHIIPVPEATPPR